MDYHRLKLIGDGALILSFICYHFKLCYEYDFPSFVEKAECLTHCFVLVFLVIKIATPPREYNT